MAPTDDNLQRALAAHYGRADLGAAILAAVRAAGGDPDHPTIDDLAPFDHFHTGFRAGTTALLRLADLPPGSRVLDIGGGIGGPARTLAHDLGCRVTVLDASAAFCAAGALLTARTGLGRQVSFLRGNALALPFTDGSCDAVWMQNVGMNIPDKARLCAEIARVLVPGGRLALQEVLAGPVQPAHYPTPWATEAAQSFLATPHELRAALAAAGLREVAWREPVTFPPEPGAPAVPPLSVLLWGEETSLQLAAISRRNAAEGRLLSIMAIAERA
jgi:SAM-dependent methyltransferase